jgi:hypothetical protein
MGRTPSLPGDARSAPLCFAGSCGLGICKNKKKYVLPVSREAVALVVVRIKKIYNSRCAESCGLCTYNIGYYHFRKEIIISG